MNKLKQCLDIEEVDLHRKDDCKQYDDCLDCAALKSWKSFSCVGCDEYKPSEIGFRFVTFESEPVLPNGLFVLTRKEQANIRKNMEKIRGKVIPLAY